MTIPAKAEGRLDPGRLAIQVAMYVVITWLTREFLGFALVWVGGYFVGGLAGNLAIALVANLLVLRMFTTRHLVDLGMWWNRTSMENMAIGIVGGAGAASLVLAPSLLAGAAHISGTPRDQPSFAVLVFVVALLALGAMGEELMMRGYGFQILLAGRGPPSSPSASFSPLCTQAIPTPHGWESPIPPASASCSDTPSCAAATCGCPPDSISAGTLH
jgi:membrane protease YdiL (CAAX protease family)